MEKWEIDESEYRDEQYEPCATCGKETIATWVKCCNGWECGCYGQESNTTPFCSINCEEDFID